MNRNLLIHKLIMAIICLFNMSTLVLAQEIVIFPTEGSTFKVYPKCDDPSSIQIVDLKKIEGEINWKWEKKIGYSCKWIIKSPHLSLTQYLKDGYLVIKIQGNYQGNYIEGSPNVVFVGNNSGKSMEIEFKGYFVKALFETGEKVTVRIPLKDFFYNMQSKGEKEEPKEEPKGGKIQQEKSSSDKDNVYLIDPAEFSEIHFKPGHNSVRGKLSISYIAITSGN
ncbi:secreted protein [Candidatus Magnetobacterium bavaricum]|uniref:Secreted protein n=1 Tax=Candidatus Magnetobacterium bavaricum TaxID=29290 RepID=A0A0F3GTP8_9BACT|nr:secreted protein [Candidatus Magnetobacterium bavaricum]